MRSGGSRVGPGAAGRGNRRGTWLIGALVVVVVGALVWIVFGTPVLGVRHIEVTGTAIAGVGEVRAAAAVALGTPLARIDTAAVVERVRTLPPVAHAVVSRSWPDTLRILVTERVAAAAVEADGAYLLLDAGGVVFHTVSARPASLLLVRVDSPGPDDPATRAALQVIKVLTPALREQVRVVVAKTPHRLRLELRGGGAVVWGDAGQSERKAQVATALLAESRGQTIDVSAPGVVAVS